MPSSGSTEIVSEAAEVSVADTIDLSHGNGEVALSELHCVGSRHCYLAEHRTKKISLSSL